MNDIIPVLVGGALALAGGVATHLWQQSHERRTIAFALAGEINAIVQIIQALDYETRLSVAVSRIQGGEDEFTMDVKNEGCGFFVIYDSNASKIGVLPRNVAKKVAEFYTLAKATFDGAGVTDLPNATKQDLIERIVLLQKSYALLQQLGQRIVPELEQVGLLEP